LISYVLRDVPVGLKATGTRRERDSISTIEVPADRYWGARTQRALRAFPASADGVPDRFYRSYGHVKRAAAMLNGQAGRLPAWKAAAIARAADDLVGGLLADQFPLPIWQSGSGRDADTNVNEVLANRAAQLLGAAAGSREPVNPERDVNMGQSLGGTFTASMYVATVMEIEDALVPRASALVRALDRSPGGPTNLSRRLRAALERLDEAEGPLHEIGVDLDDAEPTPEMTAEEWQTLVALIASETARPFIVGRDRFSDRVSLDAIGAAMAAVRGLAVVLLDIADAIHNARQTGARSEIYAPIEAMTMVCMYIIGQDHVVTAAACRGNPATGHMRPLIVAAMLNSVRRLADACEAMRRIVTRAR
jgi:fumarate hydratase class II